MGFYLRDRHPYRAGEYEHERAFLGDTEATHQEFLFVMELLLRPERITYVIRRITRFTFSL